MGIRFVCHHCGYALHVKDFQAGKRGKCPNCLESFRIPDADSSYSFALEDESAIPEEVTEPFKKANKSNGTKLAKKPSDSVAIAFNSEPSGVNEQRGVPQAERAPSSNPVVNDLPNWTSEAYAMPAVLANAVDAKWFVRPPSGGQFGPAPSQLLVSWIVESRVTADSFLWRDGLAEWQLASELVPELFVNQKPVPAVAASLNEILSGDRSDAANKSSDIGLDGTPSVRSGAILKKKMQKRRQQLTMVILLASVSLILLCILIFVLVFQVSKPPQISFL